MLIAHTLHTPSHGHLEFLYSRCSCPSIRLVFQVNKYIYFFLPDVVLIEKFIAKSTSISNRSILASVTKKRIFYKMSHSHIQPKWLIEYWNVCLALLSSRLNSTKGWLADAIGNYTVDSKCTWLIESPIENAKIRLHIKEFATECGWDHLYIFDGDSVSLNEVLDGNQEPR